MAVFFQNVNLTPPGGFFLEVGGERVAARTYCEIEPMARDLLHRHRVAKPVEQAVAECMEARLPPEARFLFRYVGQRPADVPSDRVYPKEAIAKSLEYSARNVEPADTVSRRLRACMACPRHTREYCVVCTGHMARVINSFGGRRVSVPEDQGSGVCKCARAYESAICSVAYGPGEPVWPGAPETCWRNAR